MTQCPTCGRWQTGPEFSHLRRGYPEMHGPYYRRLTAMGARTDEDVKRDVKDALFWDTWVDSDQVTVDVASCVVTLSGTVDSATEKRAAEDDAWDVPGVADVRNKLQIKSKLAGEEGRG